MDLKILSIYDQKSGVWFTPFTARSMGEAIRMFCDTVDDPSTVLHKYPQDFDLFHIGNFENTTGVITTASPAVHIGSALQYKGEAAETSAHLETFKLAEADGKLDDKDRFEQESG